MSQTVVGFFDDHSDARQALEQLHSEGISRDRIDISSGSTAANIRGGRSSENSDVNPVSGSERDENSVRRTADDRTVDPEGRNTNVFTDFFNNLFGNNDKDDAGRYSHVAQRSEAIVTVHATSREEAELAADILDDCGATDVDKKASESGYLATGTAGEDSDIRSTSGNSRIFESRLDENRRLRDFDRE